MELRHKTKTYVYAVFFFVLFLKNHLSSVDSENESQHDSGIASAPANIDWQSIEAETALCGTNVSTQQHISICFK